MATKSGKAQFKDLVQGRMFWLVSSVKTLDGVLKSTSPNPIYVSRRARIGCPSTDVADSKELVSKKQHRDWVFSYNTMLGEQIISVTDYCADYSVPHPVDEEYPYGELVRKHLFVSKTAALKFTNNLKLYSENQQQPKSSAGRSHPSKIRQFVGRSTVCLLVKTPEGFAHLPSPLGD